jgi:hypothetical protein
MKVLDEIARQQLDEVTTAHVELSGTIRDGQITFDPLADAPILVHGNEVVIINNARAHFSTHCRRGDLPAG